MLCQPGITKSGLLKTRKYTAETTETTINNRLIFNVHI